MDDSENPVLNNYIWREPVERDAGALAELEQAVIQDDDADFETLLITRERPVFTARAASPTPAFCQTAVWWHSRSSREATLQTVDPPLVVRPFVSQDGPEKNTSSAGRKQKHGTRIL